ncbi:DUF397 domain-containing protein [Streptomyces sp. NPDC056831]|uniref:DUF397 domain-containing protein n=1 Tax=Streptomyces sp. NPDC056831 TaxID=3345954 RepID=UPI0036A29A5A
MRTIDLSTTTWRKSSYGNQDGGECIEVSDDQATVIPVRDSKTPLGPNLSFAADRWSAFVTAVNNGLLSNP